MNRLKGKTVLITGATSGIGKATAELFAENGTNLILTGRREKKLAEFAKELQSKHKIIVLPFDFDIRDLDACRAFSISIEETGVDILINNAGLAVGVDSVQSGDIEDWNTMIDTNIKGLLAMTRYITPGMIERNSGHVINLGSIAGHEAYPSGVVYCASKHAVKAITEATKKDLHGTKIRVSMVSPGLVETEFSNVRFKGDDKRADSVYKGIDPLTAQDIAEIIVFIANRPEHVNILDSIVMPVYQSSAQMVHRDE
tara:strand:+ start:3726 stop:4493 length:768 start_codon:yes stop_codon:yes gene_type:complete